MLRVATTQLNASIQFILRISFIIQLRSTCQLMRLSITPVPAVLAETLLV